MSNIVKLAGKTPRAEAANGLDATAASLLAEPQRLRVAVIWYDVQKITEHFDEDTGRYRIPTIEVTKVEPLGFASDVPQEVVDVVLDAAQERLGQEALPFDSVDPDGVEVYATGPDNDDARERVR